MEERIRRTFEVEDLAGLRKRAKAAALRLVDFMRDKRIATVIAVGPSARYSAEFLARAMEKKYPGERPPQVRSLGRIEDLLRSRGRAEFAANIRTAAGIMQRDKPEILKHLASPVLLYDEEARSGMTLKGAKVLFKRHLKAPRVYTGVFQAKKLSGRLEHHVPSVIGMKEQTLGMFPIHPARGDLDGMPKEKRRLFARTLRLAEGFWSQLLKEL